jgi:hypothetical protein
MGRKSDQPISYSLLAGSLANNECFKGNCPTDALIVYASEHTTLRAARTAASCKHYVSFEILVSFFP